MKVSFEYIPEYYVGEYPYAIIRIKESQLTPKVESEIKDLLAGYKSKLFKEKKL